MSQELTEPRIKRDCDEFDLNSKGVRVTHLCPSCSKRDWCSIHQSKDVENYKHVCNICKKEWLQYTDDDIKKHREIEPILTSQILSNVRGK